MPPVLLSPSTVPLLRQSEVLPSVTLSTLTSDVSETREEGSLAALMAASMVLDSRLNCSLTALISSATASAEPAAVPFSCSSSRPKPWTAAARSPGSEMLSLR